MIPNRIGRYEIRGELGRGGMASVYHGFDPLFERAVAIKVLPRELLHDPAFRARFEREAKIIAALEHPAIVPVYDYGEHEGQPYIVMRYMAGGSLANRLTGGPLPLTEAANILAALAPGLDRAHGKGIIHRDLKPGNILFDEDDRPYLSDFGIARLTQTTSALTATGYIGTPAYMSPEQARAEKEVDSRSDLYALGCIVCHRLTGHAPYEAQSPLAMMWQHVNDPVPRAGGLRPDLPEAVEAVIQRAMAKERDARFPNAAQMAADLMHVAATASTLDRRPMPAQPPRTRGGEAQAQPRSEKPRTGEGRPRDAAPPVPPTAYHSPPPASRGPASPLPRPAAPLPRPEPRPTPTPPPDWVPTPQPTNPFQRLAHALRTRRGLASGLLLASVIPIGLVALAIVGLAARAILQGPAATRAAALTAAVTTAATSGPTATGAPPTVIVPSATAAPSATFTPRPTATPTPTITPRPTPTGPPPFGPDEVDNLTLLKTLARGAEGQAIAFSPDGHLLASAGGPLLVIELWDVDTGEQVRVLEGHTEPVRAVAFSRDGLRLASGAYDKTVRIWDLESGEVVRVLEGHTDVVRTVSFSPDGHTLASCGGDTTIRVWDVDTGDVRHVLTGHTATVRCALSPDGRTLVSGSEDNTARLWNPATGDELHVLEGHTNFVRAVSFSPDSRTVASASSDLSIRLWDVATGDWVRTLTGHVSEPLAVAFSPDGRLLASGGSDQVVRLWDVATGEQLGTLEKHTSFVFSLAFGAGGRILASGGGDNTINLWGLP